MRKITMILLLFLAILLVGCEDSKDAQFKKCLNETKPLSSETIDVKFYFDTMLLHFELSSYSKNTSTGEEHNTYWKLYYSPVEHKLYDDLGNYLYTDRVNTTDIIPDGTSRFLTHIDAIDRYFRYIKADEYLSGLKSTKVEDLFQ